MPHLSFSMVWGFRASAEIRSASFSIQIRFDFAFHRRADRNPLRRRRHPPSSSPPARSNSSRPSGSRPSAVTGKPPISHPFLYSPRPPAVTISSLPFSTSLSAPVFWSSRNPSLRFRHEATILAALPFPRDTILAVLAPARIGDFTRFYIFTLKLVRSD